VFSKKSKSAELVYGMIAYLVPFLRSLNDLMMAIHSSWLACMTFLSVLGCVASAGLSVAIGDYLRLKQCKHGVFLYRCMA
jgi:hypothetical protein